MIGLLDKAGFAAFKWPGGFGAVLVATLSFQGAAWVLIGIFLWQHDLSWSEGFGFRDPKLIQALGRAVLTVAFLLPVLWVLQTVAVLALTRLGWPPDDQAAIKLFENAHSWWGRWYMGLFAVVLAPVAEAFARHDVSIEAVRQASRGEEAQLVIVTHTARDAALAATIRELEALPVVRAVVSVMRVEGEEE